MGQRHEFIIVIDKNYLCVPRYYCLLTIYDCIIDLTISLINVKMSHSDRDERKADERRYNEKNENRREDRRENDKEPRRREERRDRDHERREGRDDRREERVTYRKEIKEEFDEHENCSERVGNHRRESRRDDIGEPSKPRHRHTSRSDS